MKTNILIVLSLGLTVLTIQSFAQKTEYYNDIQKEIQTAKELYNQSKYQSAYREFELIQEKVPAKSEIYSEAEYFKALSSLDAGQAAGDKQMSQFIENYSESPYINQAQFKLANYQFDKKRYSIVLRTLPKVDLSELNEDEKVLYHYQLGYSYLEQENLDKAAAEFYKIIDKNSLYSKPASYYWAHINYLKGNYESALNGFTKLNGDPTYSKVIPLYVSHIFYKQQKYNELINYIEPLIGDVEESHKEELSRLVGDSYFHLKDFNKAIPFLETYHNSKRLKSKEDNYLMGYCYYNNGDFAKAIPFLEKAAQGKDETAQNAFYHLADCYVKNDKKEKARFAFESASELDFDERIKEDALFNYAKMTYELSYSPFNETIKAFDKYIASYPNSERNNQAYQYLVKVYMVTKNYESAIASIEKIQVKNSAIRKAYQRVTFYRGLELFNNLSYNRAIESFDKSLENSFSDRELKARAIYWRAEALYRLGDYQSAITEYNKFLVTPGAFSLNEYKDAHYNLGYAYFKLEDFQAATSMFREFLTAAKTQRSEKVADAINRVGDGFFLVRDYDEAVKYYQESFRSKLYDPDYALFQIAFCEGLQRKQQDKITHLKNLLRDYPESAYRDDALYELGRAYERINNDFEAIKLYNEILTNYSQSTYKKKALLQLGLINYNNQNLNKSLEYYKQVVENYANSEEAKSALVGIKNNYVELNNVDAYFAYTRSLGQESSITPSEQDALTYQAAEKRFMAGDSNADSQFKRYLNEFPFGGYILNAHFYLAEALYQKQHYSESLEHYNYVAQQGENIFSEPALSKAAELTLNGGDYRKALELFNRLETISNTKWNKLKAQAGKMKCNFELQNFSDAITSAENVKSSDKASEALIRDADYIITKSSFELGNLTSALTGFQNLAKETQSAQGAEAKYLVSEIYFRQKKYQPAEDEIIDFISSGTPHQYWLGKSFILLSEIYMAKNDIFQAKHTLKSLVENYNDSNDGIIKEAAQKLSAIEAKENAEQNEARKKSVEINLENQ